MLAIFAKISYNVHSALIKKFYCKCWNTFVSHCTSRRVVRKANLVGDGARAGAGTGAEASRPTRSRKQAWSFKSAATRDLKMAESAYPWQPSLQLVGQIPSADRFWRETDWDSRWFRPFPRNDPIPFAANCFFLCVRTIYCVSWFSLWLVQKKRTNVDQEYYLNVSNGPQYELFRL